MVKAGPPLMSPRRRCLWRRFELFVDADVAASSGRNYAAGRLSVSGWGRALWRERCVPSALCETSGGAVFSR